MDQVKNVPMDQIKSVLVPIDFSECSADALRQAARIASWTNASLAAINVAEVPAYAVDPQPFFPVALPDMMAVLAVARERWGLWAPAKEIGRPVEFDAVLGVPRMEVVERIRRDRPDLVVVGAHGQTERRGAGPVASACVQYAPTKVLVVRQGQSGEFKSVVACLDFTETSLMVLEQAIRIAAHDGAAMRIVHIYDDPWRGAAPPPHLAGTLPEITAKYADAVRQRMEEFCAPLAHEIRALKATFHAEAAASHGRGIIDFAAREKADLVVLGTRAKWNLRDFVWGSTAERVMRELPCSTLTVPPVQPAA
jgi:nucleotide-binding universal stress UspA family protein